MNSLARWRPCATSTAAANPRCRSRSLPIASRPIARDASAMPGSIAGTGGRLLVIGADHRTTPTAWRDQFALIEASLSTELDKLRARGFRDLILLATCDRIELVTVDIGVETARRIFTA